MPNTYVRKPDGGIRPTVDYLSNLSRVTSKHLPELQVFPLALPQRKPDWKTFRLRPEVTQVISTMQNRYAANSATGTILTVSEIVAAALVEAMPALCTTGRFKA